MTRPRRSPRSPIALLTSVIMLTFGAWMTAAPAQAAYTSGVAAGVLTLAGTGGDDFAVVTCDTGSVKIEGQDPGSGAATCASITSVVVNADGGNDSIFLDDMSGAGFTSLTSQALDGGDGDDQLIAAPVAGTIDGGIGEDRIYPDLGNQTIDGEAGFDTVFDLSTAGATATDTSLVTTPGGTDSITNIEKLGLTGGAGNDTFDLGDFTGATDVNGNYGGDTVIGGSGPDFVIAGGDGDIVDGNEGNDLIVPNDGNDTVTGGAGTDTLLVGDDGTFTLTNSSASGPFLGSDTLAGFEKATVIFFGATNFNGSGFTGNISLSASDADDSIVTGPGNDAVSAGKGDDVIKTKAGRDTLNGAEGRDALNGGPDRDDCNGGPGADTLKNCP